MDLQTDELRSPDTLRDLNNAAIPDVNRIDHRKADWLIAHSSLARVATLDGQAAGVIIVLHDYAHLDSDYFRWFTQRYENFLYIDRVIVAATARRRGVATKLYLEVDALALSTSRAIASEVYCEPPNIASLRFHQKMGYREIGRQFSPAESKTVSKLMKFADHAKSRGEHRPADAIG